MIFVMNDTDISIFGTGKLDIPFGDNSIYIICKDVKKTAFSAEQIEKILSFAQAHQDAEIKFLQAESKEELLFIIGGLAFTGEERVSLVNLSVNIPKAYADRVELVCTEAKPKRRRRSKSDQNPLIPSPAREELKRARSSKNRIPLTDKKEEAAKTQAPPPSRNIKPESGTPVQLPENARKAQQEEKRTVQPASDVAASGIFTVEDAKKVVCNFGVANRGRTLGEIALDGAKGIEDLQWMAYKYKGPNDTVRQAARVLLKAAS